jgi:hypothetical protein
MPFHFASSVKAGPFRFNLSTSGVGFSVGVKGLRFGIGSRGHYVRAGLGGFRYQRTFNPQQARSRPLRTDNHTEPRAPQTYGDPSIQMMAVSSANVTEMQDERFSELLAELNDKQKSSSLATMLALLAGATGLLLTLLLGPLGVALGLGLVGIGWVIGARVDDAQRSAVILYDLEPAVAAAYEEATKAFDRLVACSGKWHVDSGGAVQDIHAWKRNAGASHVLDRRGTEFSYGLPRVLKTNITPPMMAVGKEKIYFLPDVLLVVHDQKVGAVAYDTLTIRWQDSRFIEEGAVPQDTTILGHTWKHPNKSGGPDRRFANNPQIPVCLYETIHLTSSNGLNELLQVSRSGVAEPFSASLEALVATTGAKQLTEMQALPHL